jgi:PTS system nitrogen regulatory IIA component
MNLETLISSNAVINNLEIKSKKRALESLAEKLTEEVIRSNQSSNQQPSTDRAKTDNDESAEEIDALKIFQLLTEREKLGSTGMGHGVALPHARTNLTKTAVGALLKLDKGIDFDSPDQQPTDLIFALLVPEHFTDEHLKILANLATLFSDEAFCQAARNSSKNELYANLINWQLSSQVS